MQISPRTTIATAAFALVLGADAGAQDPLAQLGLTEPRARELANGVATGRSAPLNVDASITRAFKAMPASVRATVTTGTWAWARTHLGSAAFKAEYARARNEARPEAPKFDGTPADELKKFVDEQTRSIADMRKNVLPTLPADQRAAFETQIKQQEDMMKGKEFQDMMRTSFEQQRAGAVAEHERRTRSWEEEWPVDSQKMLAKRIREFLAVCADVDFAARTQIVDGLARFVNPVYERKAPEWKACYRAGREPTEAARRAATAWLAALGG